MEDNVLSGVRFLPVTWERATVVWWSIFWRWSVFSALASIVVSFILGVVMMAFGAGPETTVFICQVASLTASVPVFILITGMVLEKKFSGFRVALIEVEKDSGEVSVE